MPEKPKIAMMDELLDPSPESLERFLIRWHGPPDRNRAALALGQALPEPLRKWFETVSRWSREVTVQNRVVPPYPDPEDPAVQVFWVENQAVWLWGYRVDSSDDPIVLDRENEVGKPWQTTNTPLSVFLLQVAVFEALMGARYGASAIDIGEDAVEQITRPLTPVPTRAWHWLNDAGLWVGNGLLAMSAVNDRPGTLPTASSPWWVQIGATSEEPLGYLDSFAIEWVWKGRSP
jgi:hypothetical protein